eukprot:TRINITY_DN55428_c0_g1_i1.p1 TRINITY_DN55428_c0_g1~~TRINITY_DN55428_c0_g1_i1.p1  ORF type:complete len:387 (-),score=76.26 TRINITY_DN55428_c0_g1_i1:121-1281(-)
MCMSRGLAPPWSRVAFLTLSGVVLGVGLRPMGDEAAWTVAAGFASVGRASAARPVTVAFSSPTSKATETGNTLQASLSFRNHSRRGVPSLLEVTATAGTELLAPSLFQESSVGDGQGDKDEASAPEDGDAKAVETEDNQIDAAVAAKHSEKTLSAGAQEEYLMEIKLRRQVIEEIADHYVNTGTEGEVEESSPLARMVLESFKEKKDEDKGEGKAFAAFQVELDELKKVRQEDADGMVAKLVNTIRTIRKTRENKLIMRAVLAIKSSDYVQNGVVTPPAQGPAGGGLAADFEAGFRAGFRAGESSDSGHGAAPGLDHGAESNFDDGPFTPADEQAGQHKPPEHEAAKSNGTGNDSHSSCAAGGATWTAVLASAIVAYLYGTTLLPW